MHAEGRSAEEIVPWLRLATRADAVRAINAAARLNGMTGGEGRYTIAMSHYEAVPPSVQQQLMGQYKVRDDE